MNSRQQTALNKKKRKAITRKELEFCNLLMNSQAKDAVKLYGEHLEHDQDLFYTEFVEYEKQWKIDKDL